MTVEEVREIQMIVKMCLAFLRGTHNAMLVLPCPALGLEKKMVALEYRTKTDTAVRTEATQKENVKRDRMESLSVIDPRGNYRKA